MISCLSTIPKVSDILFVRTEVPANHYEKILGEVKEQFMNEIASVQFLNIVYKQLDALRKENERGNTYEKFN